MTQLLTPPAGDPRTPAEYTYDLIKAGQFYTAAPTAQEIAEPLAAAVRVEHTQSECGHKYIDFEVGEGAAEVRIGSYDGEKPGVNLVIARECLNEGINEIITLADVRQLRDNLTALLNDPRVIATFGGAPDPAPAVRIAPHICDDKNDPRYGKEVAWVDYTIDTPAGVVEAALSDRWEPQLFTDKLDLGDLAEWAARVPAIVALLNHPDIQAALTRAQAGAPQKPISKAA